MADLISLKRRRASCRSWLTRVITGANELLQTENVMKEELELAFNDVNIRLDKLLIVQEEIEVLLEESEMEIDIEESESYLRKANDVMAKVKHRLSHWADVDSTCVVSPVGPSQGYFPKIDIGTFAGDFSSWQPFYDKFTALIDNSDAKKAIEGLSLTHNNYKIALDISKTRFGRKERIIFGHIQNLLAIDFQNSPKNVKNLWNTFNELQSNIRSLETLGNDGVNYGLILTPLIVCRLPQDMRLMWARQSHEKEADFDFLMQFLQGEIENRERSQSFALPSATPATVGTQRFRDNYHQHRHPGTGRESRGPRATATGIALNNNSVAGRESRGHRATAQDQSTKTTFGAGREARGPKATNPGHGNSTIQHCVFCGGGHTPDSCRAVFKMDINDVKEKIKINGLCFVCMRGGHLAKRCHSTCQICQGRHNELFCVRDSNGSKTSGSDQSDLDRNDAFVVVSSSSNNNGDLNDSCPSHVTFCQSTFSDTKTVLQTLSVKLNGVDMNILFDSGSDKSFITTRAVSQLRPPFVGRENMRMSGFGSRQPSPSQTRNVYGVMLDLGENKKKKILLTEVESISATLYKPKIPIDPLSYFSPQCQFSADLKTNNHVTIDILIGQDYYWHLIDAKEIIQSPCGLVAQRTIFGLWVLSGSFQDKGQNESQRTFRQFLCLNDIPESQFRKLWNLDYLECNHEIEKGKSMCKVLVDFENKVTHIDGRYEVSLPWVEGKKQQLQCNMKEVLIRLNNLDKKLSKDPNLKEGYDNVLQSMEDAGIVEEVVREKSENPNPVFYLPHRPVVKNSSTTTKIRPVFDASAEGPNRVSLNDCMEAGPNLLPILSDILIRFRRHRFAISADIEKAFLQISVSPEERDVHRFLWKVDNDIRIMRIKRVPFGNKSSPFLLNATVQHHLSCYRSESRVVQELSQNMYVDDFLSGGDSVEEVLSMVSEASDIMSHASMKLTKWSSNSPEVEDNIQRSFQDKGTGVQRTKVLGVKWITQSDTLGFDSMFVSPDVVVTKRVILSCIARIFDPLGLISQFVISIKILFQQVWKLGLSWDEPVPDDIAKKFTSWTKDLTTLQGLTVARCFVSISWKEKLDVELHCFCDASLKAYGAVVYIRVFEADGSVTVSLVLSKSKMSPLKPVTLPRLELLGACIGAKLVFSVKNALQLQNDVRYYCWTDSTVTLQWIKSDPTKWKMFVCNRVVQIQEITTPECWSQCIGKENPADLLTRGLSSKDLVNNSLWFHGPPWLKEVNASQKREDHHENSKEEEDIQDYDKGVHEEVESTVCLNKVQKIDEVLDTKRWGDFSKAVRIVGWIHCFVNRTRRKKDTEVSTFLQTEELQFAKQRIIWYLQHVQFADEIETLSKGYQVKKDSVLHKMRPFLDEDGIMRMSGRLQFLKLSFEGKHPIILLKCPLVSLMVRREHLKLKHAGVPQMMTSLRNHFWILGLRSIAKRVKRECVRCQRFDSSPCTQIISPLPQERLTRASPFSFTGLDFAGPVYTADMAGKKFYILIFTCCVTRAIHIELCASLSLIDFMLAFRRFVSRRGMPTKILSDNAKTFHATAKEITRNCVEEGVKWVFNTPRAPWRGGIWERLVRSVKQSLKKTIGNRILTRNELETVLIEIEFCINSRPLTYVSDDPDCVGVLSPSHFLLGRGDGLTPNVDNGNDSLEMTGLLVRESYKHSNEQLDIFWKVWQEDYIRNLPHVKSSAKNSVLVEGSVVLLSEDNCPRLMWPLGKVIKLLPGRDGVVRTVKVKTAKGSLVRPIQRVHCLELDRVEMGTEDSFEEVKRSTRGRLIKPPKRLDL